MSFIFGFKKGLKKDKFWTHVSKKIREIKTKCEHCGAPSSDVHHVIGRRKVSTKYYPPNLIALCKRCHVFSSEFSAHLTPKDFKQWFIQKFPQRWQKIQLREATTMKIYEAEALFLLEYNEFLKENLPCG